MSIYDAGVDAFTFTMTCGSDASQWVAQMVDKYLQEDVSSGNDLKESGQSRFSGIRSKHVFMGTDGKHDLFEVKTGYADDVANAIKAEGVKVHPTRMDYAVTYPMRGDREAYTNDLRRQVREAIALPGQRIPGHSVLHEKPDSGNTLYIQTNDKSFVHRTYNKAVESPGVYPKDAYRHEAQFRGKRAEGAWAKFLESPSSGWLARGYVMGVLVKYGVEEEWMLDTEPCASPSKASKSTTEKRLQWLEYTVMPVYRKLIDAGVTHEYLCEMLHKAGLNCVEEKSRQ